MRRIILKFCLILLAAIFGAVLFVYPHAASASCPAGYSAHSFYGTVSNNGQIVGAGYVVTAEINGQQVASAVTDAQGRWGQSGSFAITAPSGAIIEFYVNGVLAGSAASCIQTDQLNLNVRGAPSPSNIATTASSASNTNSAGQQPSTAPGVSGVIESSSTITFFIGEQPASVKSPQGVSITCKMPGKEASITLHNGILGSHLILDSADNIIELELTDNTSIVLSGSQQITVERVVSLASAPPDCEILEAYAFEPENTAFAPPVTLRLKYNLNSLPEGVEAGSLFIAQLTDSGEWQPIPSNVNTDESSVSAQLSHFSTYALICEMPRVEEDAYSSGTINDSNNSDGEAGGSIIAEKSNNTASPESKEDQKSSFMDKIVLAVLLSGIILVLTLFIAIIKKHRRY